MWGGDLPDSDWWGKDFLTRWCSNTEHGGTKHALAEQCSSKEGGMCKGPEAEKSLEISSNEKKMC